MTARIGYPGTESAGDVLTAANFNRMPGGGIGWAVVTSGQTNIGNGSMVDLTNLSVAVTVGTNRLIRVEGWALFQAGTSATNIDFAIRESTTTLADHQNTEMFGAGSVIGTVYASCLLVAPSGGAHTYKLSVQFSANTNNALIATATTPAHILITDLGPSS